MAAVSVKGLFPFVAAHAFLRAQGQSRPQSPRSFSKRMAGSGDEKGTRRDEGAV